MIYYPIPLNQQEAYCSIGVVSGSLNNTDNLCKSVISLPMHSELKEDQQIFVANRIKSFFR
jgi:dTDP-4-amino-4,6-dideoxygalactose transaminase